MTSFTDHGHVDLRNMFGLLYSRPATEIELSNMAALGIALETNMTQIARRIIGCHDRQSFATPYTIRFGEADILVGDYEGMQVVTDGADVSVGITVASGHQYEAHLAEFYRSQIKPGMTVVDVGANIGVHTLLASKLVGPTGKVFACEPNSENCRLIFLSLRRNCIENVNVFPFAISDQTGSAFFSTHIGSNGGLLPTADATLMNPNCVVVPTMRLDALIASKVDFIKIDTEGAEGLVVTGAMSTISKYRPIVATEFSTEMLFRVSGMHGGDYLKLFENLGYRIMLLDRDAAPGTLTDIGCISAFVDSYGLSLRIEDLAFIPLEKL